MYIRSQIFSQVKLTILKSHFLFLLLCWLIIGIFITSTIVHAQEQDVRGWYSGTVDHELFDFLDVSLSPEIRFKDNHSQLDGWLVESEFSVKATDWFRVGTFYRFQMEKDIDIGYDKNHRFGISGKFDYKIKPIEFYYRSAYHYEYSNINSSKNGKVPEAVWRHKIQAKYDRKKVDYHPFIAFEYFQVMNPMVDRGPQKIRLKAGSDYELNKRYTISLSYVYQKDILKNNPSTSHIIALDLSYDWK